MVHFGRIERAFVLFIALCGAGHFLDMLAFFRPMYRLSGHLLIATGLASWWTAWVLYRTWPALMAMRSPAELEKVIAQRTEELTRAVDELGRAELERAYLATIVESSHDAILSKDLDGVITSWNHGAERIFGYSAAEAVGRSITFLMPADCRDEEVVFLKRLRRGEGVDEFESIRLTKDERKIAISLTLSPIKDHAGHIIGISKIVRDITERKQAEAALRDSEGRFRALIETLPQLVWSAGPDGVGEYMSPQWDDYLGLGDDREVTALWGKILHPDDRAKVTAAWAAAVAGGEAFDLEFRLRRHDGAYRWFQVRAAAIREAGGCVAQWFGACTDIDDDRARTEELRRSEERQRLAFSAARISHWEWDITSDRIVYLDSLSTLYDRPDDRPFTDLSDYLSVVHPDDRDLVRAFVESAPKPGVPYEVDYRVVRADGSIRWLAGRCGTSFNEDGSPLRLIGVNLDITDRKEAEEQIRILNEDLEHRVRERTSELRQRIRLIDQAHDAIVIRSKTGRISSWNQGAELLYGWSKEEAIGRVSDELLKTQFPRPLAEIEEELDRIGSWAGELVHERRDGVRIVSASRWVLDRDESPDGTTLEINSDITERRASEEALLRSEAALKESQRLAGVGSWELDPVTDAVMWSAELYRIAGREPGQSAPRLAEFYTPESLARHGDAVAAALQTGEPYEVELEIIGGDGVNRWIISRGEVVRDHDDANVILRGTAQDVTARKRFEEELRNARDDAMAATGAKSEFLANMSHEIRTPMNGVLGMTELLLDTQLNNLQRGYAETIRGSGEALLTVINDILDFSRIEAGKLTLVSADFDLRTLMEEVVELLTPRGHQKNLEILCRISPEIPERLLGDPVRIRQVLTNLAGNAIKFTESGGVGIEAQLLANSGEEAKLRILVRDTGIGIPEDRQLDIFENFTQIDGGNSRRHGGTGLGLAICRSLVALMGGRIGLESRLGEGSTFWFEVALGKAPGQADIPGVRLGGLRVLIIDNQEIHRVILRETLESWECRPEVAVSGVEALSKLLASPEDDPFGLILIDKDMPGMDGEQTARVIKASLRHAKIPIVLLDSLGTPGDGGIGDSLWAARVTKPIRRSLLFNTLCRVVEALETIRTTPPSLSKAIERLPSPPCVLLAEDSDVNRRVAIGMAERLGCVVEAVCNGVEALAALDYARHDLILMDVQMPEMDGLTATAAIREREWGTGRHIPIIAMTAHAMQGDRERCLAAGMDGYLSKPIRPDSFREALSSVGGNPVPTSDGAKASRPHELTSLSEEILGESCGYDPKLTCEVLSSMVKDVPGRLEQLGAVVRRRDRRQLAWESHGLKGEFLTVGAEAMASTCEELMSLGERGDFVAIEVVFQRLRKQWETLAEEAYRYLAAHAYTDPGTG